MDYAENHRRSCPYLSDSCQECLMTNGGLYIPMPEHINTLCMTIRYAQCHHYIHGCSSVWSVASQLGVTHDTSRRRYRRITERLPLQLADCGAFDGRCAEIIDHRAFTVDLSLGGIRVESHVELPVRKRITFILGENGSVPSWKGQGEVRWTEKQEAGDFHSGLIITDKKTFQSLGQHLSLSSLPLI